MTVNEMAETLHLRSLTMPDPEREVESGYAGDMPSWVMGNADQGCAWLTIMNNRNIVAVAVLLDMACIVVAEGSEVPEEVVKLAESKDVNLLSSEKDVFTLSAEIAGLL